MSTELFRTLEDKIRSLGYIPPVQGDQEDTWLLKMIDIFDDIKKRLQSAHALADQVDGMLSMAKRIKGKSVDDGDYWEISDDVFQDVQKAFDELKNMGK